MKVVNVPVFLTYNEIESYINSWVEEYSLFCGFIEKRSDSFSFNLQLLNPDSDISSLLKKPDRHTICFC